jgi:uncharacterized protein YpuA (DUF1002 family)
VNKEYTRLVPLDGIEGVDAAIVEARDQIGLALLVDTGTARYAVGLDPDQAATLVNTLATLLAAGPEELSRAVTDHQFRRIIEDNTNDN